MSKPTAIICDLDGTLCDISWRIKFVSGKEKNFDAFDAGIAADPVRLDVLAMLLEEWSKYQCQILFVTGRKMRNQAETIQWLRSKLPESIKRRFILSMRHDDDHSSDVECKEQLILGLQNEFNIVLAFEDRDHIIPMIEKLGIKAIKV